MRALLSNSNYAGIFSVLLAVFCFTLNDLIIKFFSSGYPLHELVLVRTVIGLFILTFFIMPFVGGTKILKTKRIGLHIARGCCVVIANSFLFMALALMPFAEAIAIFFISPMLTTVLSAIFLKEYVGKWRWSAVIIGQIGVLIVIRPGSDVFQMASLFPILAAIGYAILNLLTRHAGRTESTFTLTYYIYITFLLLSLIIGFTLGDGQLAGKGGEMFAFVLREWIIPPMGDIGLLLALGLLALGGSFFMAHGYRVASPTLVAPIEYIAMPLTMLWGYLVFAEWPDNVALIGISCIMASGLITVWRERVHHNRKIASTSRYRR